MGNDYSRHKQKKDRRETFKEARRTIRRAQREYLNSHIENDIDNCEDEENECCADDSFDDLDCEAFMTSGYDANVFDENIDSTDGKRPSGNDYNDNKAAASEDNSTDNTDTTPPTTDKHVDDNSTDTQDGLLSPSFFRGGDKPKYIRLSKRGRFFSIFNREDEIAQSVDPRKYQYLFENIVFEGGGNKGLAYCGAVRLLEELNLWPQIKRLSGTSAGAMTATLLAIGYDSYDLEQFFSLNLSKIFLDHRFGYFSLLPNLLTSFGWNPGKRIYKWFGQKIEEKTGDMDTTFRQVYEMFGRELCVVVTDLNQMTSLYCHPKTTPDMPVRLAVRMSMGIPGLFQAVKHKEHDQTNVYVDGGVLCNYPIHCFDGWWLSMKPEDNFLEKLQPLEDIPRLLERSERFGTYNEKTLGMQLYSDDEQDVLKYQLEELRHGVQLQELPNTKLARAKIKKKKLQLKTDREHRHVVKAMNALLHALNKHNANRNEIIEREELEAALSDEAAFPEKMRLVLFGDVDNDVILDYLDKDHNGEICYSELLSFMEETGISMQNRFLGYRRRSIKSFANFMDTLMSTLLTNVKKLYVNENDLQRTVGINTGHIGTSDFVLEPADVKFVLERGRRSLEAFLKYYVATHDLEKKPEFEDSRDSLRQDSKTSPIYNASHRSIGRSNKVSASTTTTHSGMKQHHPSLSSTTENRLPELSYTKHNQMNNRTKSESSVLSDTKHNQANRTKSASSVKSVRISDKVDVIVNTKRYSSNSYDEITEEIYEETF